MLDFSTMRTEILDDIRLSVQASACLARRCGNPEVMSSLPVLGGRCEDHRRLQQLPLTITQQSSRRPERSIQRVLQT